MFLSVSGGHICSPERDTNVASPYKNNISHMNYCIDLIIGKAFCIFMFFHFPDSSLSVLKGFRFCFCIITRVKTENTPKLENEDPLRFFTVTNKTEKTFKSYTRSPHRSPEEACQPEVDFFLLRQLFCPNF